MADEEKQQDYYDLMKQENYKTLLDREVQLNNARERALKQTNAGLGAIGMQSSGYGQTARSGIESQYLAAMEGANQTYQEQNQDINLQQQQYLEQKDAETAASQYQDFASISNLMTSAANRDDLDYIMDKYGLYTDGQFDYDKAVELYGEENARQLDILYRYQTQGIENNSLVEYNYTQKGDYTYYDENGNIHSITLKDGREDGWNKENKTLNAATKGGTIPNNSYVKMTNKHGNSIYVRYYNGKYYYCTPQQYANASNRYLIKQGNSPVKE